MKRTAEGGDRKSGLRVTVATKLAVAFVCVTMVGGLIAGALIDRTVTRSTRAAFEDRLAYEATMLGQMTATALFGDLDPNDTSLREPVKALGEVVHTRLTVVSKDGTVVADSEADDPHAQGSQLGMPEIVDSGRADGGHDERDGRLYVARAIVRDGAVLGYARASVPSSEMNTHVRAVRTRMIVGSLLAATMAVALGLAFSARFVRPIRALSRGAKRVGEGDFSRRIDVAANDEVGDLAASFNDMTVSLKSAVDGLDQRNRDMRVVLDNVAQGLVTIDREGALSTECSATVTKWFGAYGSGARVWELIGNHDKTFAENFECAWEELVAGDMPLRILLHQLPKRIALGDRTIECAYSTIGGGEQRTFDSVLMVFSDITERLAAELAEAELRDVAAIFERIAKDKDAVVEFSKDADERVALIQAGGLGTVELQRTLHTLKGNSQIYGLARFASLCHAIESRVTEAGGVMSDADRTTLADDWAATRQRISVFIGDVKKEVRIAQHEHRELIMALGNGTPRVEIAKLVALMLFDKADRRLGRLATNAKQIAKKLGKDVDVVVDARDARVPGEHWADFWASLSHVVRNAVDHGVDSTETRIACGKPARATIRFSVERRPDEVRIVVSDDGAGVAWDKICARAKAAGLPHGTHTDLVNALFADGVSSKDDVSELSGRGVGMAAVKQACEDLGGSVDVTSKPGGGTTFAFTMPMKVDEVAPIVVMGSQPPAAQRAS